jgi:hypothetical protein
MDLRNNQITVGEILTNPQAKALLNREFPEVASPFLLSLAHNMTLASIIELAKGRYSQDKIDKVLAELQAM